MKSQIFRRGILGAFALVMAAGFAAFALPQAAHATYVGPDPMCPFASKSGRTIVRFGGVRLLSSGPLESAPQSVNLPAGKYKVSLFSYDEYDGRELISQPHEQFVVKFMNGSSVVATSDAISDLADNVRYATKSETVNETLTLSSAVTSVIAAHAYPGHSSPNSHNPFCAAFEKIETPAVSASCSVTPSSLKTGETATWKASATGGNGSFTYSWSGTDGLSGNASTETKSYSSSGTKTGTVTVTSDGKSATASCQVVVSTPAPALDGSCSVSPSDIEEGESATWKATATGGNGNYSYSWSGTDGLSGSGSSVSKKYTSEGTKTGTVTIKSGNDTITRTCHLDVEEEESDDLEVSCRVSPRRAEVDERVTFEARVSGGNSPFDYEWDGDDRLRGDDEEITHRYDREGDYDARVTVTDDDGNRETARCEVEVEEEEDDEPEVTVYTDTNTPGGVYLSQVPYTGAADNWKISLYVLAFLLWSGWASVAILKRYYGIDAIELATEKIAAFRDEYSDRISSLRTFKKSQWDNVKDLFDRN